MNFGPGTPNAAVTASVLSNCIAGQTTWTISGAPPSSYFVSTSAIPIAPSYTLCSGGIQTPTNRTWMWCSATNLSQWDFYPFDQSSPYAKMSLGCWFIETFPDNEQDQHDFIMVKSASNFDLANAKIVNWGDGIHKTMSLEGCQASDTYATNAPIFITNGVIYWVAILYDQTGGPVVQLYDTSTNLLMTIHSATPCTQSTGNAWYCHLGMSAHTDSAYGVYMQNITVSSGSNPVWPLLPQSDPPAALTYTNVLDNCVIRNFSSQ